MEFPVFCIIFYRCNNDYSSTMGKIAELKSGNSTVLMESSDADYKGDLMQAVSPKVEKSLDKLLENLKLTYVSTSGEATIKVKVDYALDKKIM